MELQMLCIWHYNSRCSEESVSSLLILLSFLRWCHPPCVQTQGHWCIVKLTKFHIGYFLVVNVKLMHTRTATKRRAVIVPPMPANTQHTSSSLWHILQFVSLENTVVIIWPSDLLVTTISFLYRCTDNHNYQHHSKLHFSLAWIEQSIHHFCT